MLLDIPGPSLPKQGFNSPRLQSYSNFPKRKQRYSQKTILATILFTRMQYKMALRQGVLEFDQTLHRCGHNHKRTDEFCAHYRMRAFQFPGFIRSKYLVAVTQDFWAVSRRASATFTSMSQINTGVSRKRTG